MYVVYAVVVVFGWLSLSPAWSQVTQIPGEHYREFNADFSVSNGEAKSFSLQANLDLRVDRFGEPEIPSHGFYNYVVTGTVLESGRRCDFEALLTQGRGEAESTSVLLKSGKDRPSVIKLCSGLSVSIMSTRSLLLDANLKAELYSPGLTKSIGSGTLLNAGLKTVPAPDLDPRD